MGKHDKNDSRTSGSYKRDKGVDNNNKKERTHRSEKRRSNVDDGGPSTKINKDCEVVDPPGQILPIEGIDNYEIQQVDDVIGSEMIQQAQDLESMFVPLAGSREPQQLSEPSDSLIQQTQALESNGTNSIGDAVASSEYRLQLMESVLINLTNEFMTMRKQTAPAQATASGTSVQNMPGDNIVDAVSPVRRKNFRLEPDKVPISPVHSVMSLGLNHSYADFMDSKDGDISRHDMSKDSSADSVFTEKPDEKDMKSLKEVRKYVYSVLPSEVCAPPVIKSIKRGASEISVDTDKEFSSFPVSPYVVGALDQINGFLQGMKKGDYTPQDCKIDQYAVGKTEELIGQDKPKIDKYRKSFYKTHSDVIDLNTVAPVESLVKDKFMSGTQVKKPTTNISAKQLEIMESLARNQAAVMSQADFLLATIIEVMNAPDTAENKDAGSLFMRTLQSLSLSFKHGTELSVRQLANAVLLRRKAYLEGLGLASSGVGKALKAQPLEADSLFNNKIQEAFKKRKDDKREDFLSKAIQKDAVGFRGSRVASQTYTPKNSNFRWQNRNLEKSAAQKQNNFKKLRYTKPSGNSKGFGATNNNKKY